MKSILISTLASAIAATAVSAAQFEGLVAYQVTAGKRTSEIRYLVKEGHLRMEIDSGKEGPMVALYDAKTGNAHMLLPGQPMYMTFNRLDKLAEEAMPADVDVEETGRTEEIAGYMCSEYVFKDRKNTIEVWATKGLGRFIQLSDLQKSRGRSSPWVQTLYQKELFALRIINKNRKGREDSRMEATKIEPREFEAALFEIPEGYRQFKMPGLGDLLGGE